MPNDILVDGLGSVSLQSGIVRIELTTFESLPREGSAPKMIVQNRLALSIDTFLRVHASMTAVISELETKGVIKKNSE